MEMIDMIVLIKIFVDCSWKVVLPNVVRQEFVGEVDSEHFYIFFGV